MSETFSFLLGLLVGLGTNLVSWWILAHFIIPRIEFSDMISKLPLTPEEGDSSGFRYRIKFRNPGKRGIIDISLTATIRIERLTSGRNDIQVIDIPLNRDGERHSHIVSLLPFKPGMKVSRITRLYINSVTAFRTDQRYPEHIRRKAEEKTLTLEDILTLGTKAWIQLAAFGYDEFSGARRLFTSKKYYLDDIKIGSFDVDGLAVVAATSPNNTNELSENNNV